MVTAQGAADVAERRQVENLIAELRAAPVPAMAGLRELQPYTTTLHRSVLRARPDVAALLRPILGTEIAPGALLEWCGEYDDATGIALDTAVEGLVL